MALVADDYVEIIKWHKDYQPDPHPQVGDIYSGLRAPSGGRPKDVTSPCQYWVKGMPGICIKFGEDGCGATPDENDRYPTGYNNGNCDYLGRRNWCSQYESSGDKLDEYICIAPDMFRTGLGKRDENVTTCLVLVPYPKDEILGYNEQGGVGKCDGLGMGRGAAGEGTTDLEETYKLPVVCRHYKPWIMGFGAIKPRPMGTAVLTGKNIYDGSASDPLSTLTRYLPFLFRMFNLRAAYQKCAYWDQDFGTDFEMDYLGGFASISLPEDPLTECTCTDDACTPYKTIIDEWLPNTSDTLQYVLTEEKGIVCNGVHSECPCYTGKWYFCVPDNMRDGMRITAEQILELRFWYAVWQTQEIYDAVFAEKSGPSGLTTSDLFTFDKWEKLGTEVADSVMKGKRIFQCFPIPLNQRMFDPDVYLTKEVITYPKMNVDTGTLSSTESSFPTLVRAVDEGSFVPPLDVIYPYFCKDPWNVKPCDEGSAKSGNMEIASCKIRSPEVAVFGYTVRNKEVYALNTNETGGSWLSYELKDTLVSLLPKKEKKDMNERIRNLIDSTMENVKTYKYIAKGTSDKYGYFGIGPLQLEYNTTTSIAIICEWQPGEYEVVFRNVDTKLYGACIVQDSFEFKRGSGNNIDTLPMSFSPAAKLSGHVESFGGSVDSIFPVYNRYKYGKMQDTVYYSYCMNKYTVGGNDEGGGTGDNGDSGGDGDLEGGGGEFGGGGTTGSWDDDGGGSGSGEVITKWVRVGPTGYIWAEIDNVDLSYLLDFEVVNATMSYRGVKPICGESGGTIGMEIIFPKPDDPDAIKREHLLPNCVLLKSPEPQGFFNEDWSLFISYKYKLLETHKADANSITVWPSDLDGEESPNKFVDPPFSLSAADGGGFKVEDIRSGTIAVMAYVVDDDDRLQSAVATKMLCDVVTTRCRPVEIFYSYTADAVGYDLTPNSGFFTWMGGDKVLSGDYTHHNRPACGDHDCVPDKCVGPMWYPFDDCSPVQFYSWYSGAVSCTAAIEGQPRYDLRYGMAHDYEAWVRPGGNWAASCGNGWYYSYSKAGASVFSGYAKIRTHVLPGVYDEMGWTMPPFGNDGREITERWLSQEHYGFWDLSGVDPIPRSEYMPLVFDDEMLFTSFNAFDEKGRIGLIDDCLHTTCMLNCMLSDVIGEKFQVTYTDVEMPAETARFRFEDLFRIINHGWCMYPPPVYEGPNDTTSARRYSFDSVTVNEKVETTNPDGSTSESIQQVSKEVAWAWREYWKDIERQACSTYGEHALNSTLFNFVDFNKPEYYFDCEKTEHRLITDEGDVNIVFTAPVAGEEGGHSYSEISIEGGSPRKFEIIYDLYDSEQVEWLDEGGDGTEGGSGGEGGEGGSGIYEAAMGDDWFHDVNTIFDSNASAGKSDDRKIVLSKDALLGDTHAWYNRGLIANIPKNRLTYLPYEADRPAKLVPDIPPDSSSEHISVWYNDSLFSREIVFSLAHIVATIIELSFSGNMGVKKIHDGSSIGGDADYYAKAGIYCDPAVTIAECAMDDEYPCPGESGFPPTIIYKYEGEKGNRYSYSKLFGMKGQLPTTPKRMLHSTASFQVKLTLFPEQHLMLSKGSMSAVPAFYVDAVEPIKVWEQRYITSTGDFGDKNPDGEDSYDLRSYERDRKNAGQYFPATDILSASTDDSGEDNGDSGGDGTLEGGGGEFGGGGVTGSWDDGGGGVGGSGAITCLDKMTMIGAGDGYNEDIDLSISIGNLKTIEKEEQQNLYNDAYNKDNYDTMTYSIILPPNIQQFLATFSMGSSSLDGECEFISEKLCWDDHYLVSSFQDFAFWTPGGHYFKWGSRYRREKCWMIGPVETVYTPVVVHHKHGGEEAPISPYEAYVGWGKLIYYEGKLAQSIIIGKGIGPSHYTWAGPIVQEVFG